jgi:hypothetical protein
MVAVTLETLGRRSSLTLGAAYVSLSAWMFSPERLGMQAER